MGFIIVFALIAIVVFGFFWLIGAAMAVSNIQRQQTPKEYRKDEAPEKVGAPELWGD